MKKKVKRSKKTLLDQLQDDLRSAWRGFIQQGKMVLLGGLLALIVLGLAKVL